MGIYSYTLGKLVERGVNIHWILSSPGFMSSIFFFFWFTCFFFWFSCFLTAWRKRKHHGTSVPRSTVPGVLLICLFVCLSIYLFFYYILCLLKLSNCFSINLLISNTKTIYFTFFIKNCKYSFENTRPTVVRMLPKDERFLSANSKVCLLMPSNRGTKKSQNIDLESGIVGN